MDNLEGKHNDALRDAETALSIFAAIYAAIEGFVWLPAILGFGNEHMFSSSWRWPIIIAIVIVILSVPTLVLIDGRIIKRLNAAFAERGTYNMLAGYPSLLLLHFIVILFAAAIPLGIFGIRPYYFPFDLVLVVCAAIIIVVAMGFVAARKGKCAQVRGKAILSLVRALSTTATIMTFLVVADILLFILNN